MEKLEKLQSTLFQDFFNPTPDRENIHTQVTDEEGTSLFVNVLGHNPSDINVEVDSRELKITSDTPKLKCKLITPINLTFTISKNREPTPISAEIKNGLLTLKFQPSIKSKQTKIEVTY